jgi:serine/threonine-protein kinase
MKPPKPQFQKGDRIADRYEVIRVLGRGGMGVVYLVRDGAEGPELALKTMLPQYVTHKRAVERFTREVQVVRQLNHPSIVKILDAEELDSLIYYTMEYVQGKSLRRFLDERKRLGLGSTVRILALLAHTLEHAHEANIIHRDLSPENVMVLADGSIKLLDFGLAKLTDAQVAFTMVGTSLGKKEYNAPEQRANAAEVDARADIYSMGVMFFEMLAGQRPKPGEKLTDFVPDLPAAADRFYEAATALDPTKRHADARAFRQALMALYERGSGKKAGGAGWVGRFRAFVARLFRRQGSGDPQA